MGLDTSNAKSLIHIIYGRLISDDKAALIPNPLINVCNNLGVPVVYIKTDKRNSSVKDFRPLPDKDTDLCYLHPHFLKDEKAQEFISLLTELTKTEFWGEIEGHLRENYPIYMKDLEAARDRFAPELLLPAELQHLSKVIPIDADKSEINYLSAKVRDMSGEQKNIFNAVVEAGWSCNSVAAVINLTENLDCFKLFPALDEAQYGDCKLDKAWAEGEAVFHRLENSEDPAERAFAVHITMLERCVDEAEYGRHAAEQEGGRFTSQGVVTKERSLQGIYHGVQDIPEEYRIPSPPPAMEGDEPLIMVCNADLSVLLLEMHALGGDYMKNANHNLKALIDGGTDFFVMMNKHILTVTPAETLFHKDTAEHEAWMTMDKTPDISTYVMSVMERSDGRVMGNLYETAFEALHHYIRDNSIKHGDPAAEDRLATYLDVLRWAVEENRQVVPAAKFLSQISAPYMARSHEPQRGRFRVTPEAAKDIVAQNAADVFKMYPNPFAQMRPIDAAKPGLWAEGKCEFYVRHGDWERLEKWAERASGDILRQMECGERNKSKNKGEEL